MAQTHNPIKNVPSFVDLGRAYWEMPSAETWLALCANMDRLRDSLEMTVSPGSDRTIIVNRVTQPGQDNGPEKIVTIEDCTPGAGEAIQLYAAVFVDGNKTVYLADANDETRPCVGVVSKVKNMGALGIKVDVQTNGRCRALVTNMSGNGGTLRLSVTAGRLTDNVNESGKQINQECGSFVSYLTNAFNQVNPNVAEVAFSYCAPSGFGSV